ncbi:MAG: FtsX-like permease family protein [Acidobacteria bacterium]|nr:FtsX-like permease family protein [Acidobacteriota bacterium]
MSIATHDLRLAVRSLVRRPLFTGLAVLSLAVGIGANTAIFSAVNRLLLKPMSGIENSDRIVEVGNTTEGGFYAVGYPDLVDLRAQRDAFEEVAGWLPGTMSRARPDGDGGERIGTMHVSSNYFGLLGTAPYLGRFFRPDEDRGVGEHPVVVVSHRFWRSSLGADAGSLGTVLLLNREPHTIVGVAAPGFRSHLAAIRTDVWIPLMQAPELLAQPDRLQDRAASWVMVLARLMPEQSVEETNALVATVFARTNAIVNGTSQQRSARAAVLRPVPAGGRDGVAIFLTALSGLVVLLLLVTCSNVAGMLLGNAAGRQREMAVRLAMGCSRMRLVRLLGTEALVLFGALGVLLARGLLARLTFASLPVPFLLDLDLSMDLRVLIFTLALTLFTGLIFGTLPALRSTRPSLVPALKEESTNASPAALRLRRVLVSGQIGFAVVLVSAALLFLRSLGAAEAVDVGFRADDVVVTSIDLSFEGYTTPELGLQFYDDLLTRVRAIPGAGPAAVSTDLPLDLSRNGAVAALDYQSPEDREAHLEIEVNQVSRAYLEVLSIPVLRGRGFEQSDTRASGLVAVVSQTFAERAWPDASPLGHSFELRGAAEGVYTVIGVAADAKNAEPTEIPRPFAYLLIDQNYAPGVVLTTVLPGPFEQVAPALRTAILEVDPSLSLVPVRTLADYTGVAVLPQKVAASVTSSLGAIALFLSGLGIYGIVALLVAQRVREIGIRMALGAERRGVVARVMWSAVKLTLPGFVLGAIGALAMGPVLRSMLIGISPTDPLALVGVIAGLALVVCGATMIPAVRAARIEPVDVLRCQ